MHNNPVNNIDPTGLFGFSLTGFTTVMGVMSKIGMAFMRFYPIMKYGLVVADILELTAIGLKIFESGWSSVTPSEWATVALITSTVLFGGKAARMIAKGIFKRVLGLTTRLLGSFDKFIDYLRSFGIDVRTLQRIGVDSNGKIMRGAFRPMRDGLGRIYAEITVFKNGLGKCSTVLHEFVHYKV